MFRHTDTLGRKISPYVYPGTELARGDLEMGIFVKHVCRMLDVHFNLVVGPRKYRNLVEVRQACYYALVRGQKKTTVEVAKYFNRHHASVIHGCRVWENCLHVKDPNAMRIQAVIDAAQIDYHKKKIHELEKNF